MVWLAWRQHRTQILVTAGLLVVVGVFLLVHGQLVASARSGVAGSAELEKVLGDRFQLAYQALGWLPQIPLLVGMFWGAPVLAREFEQGTFRVAWTQSVTRRRWLTTKLTMLSGLVFATGLALGGMVSLWLNTFSGTRFDNRFGDAAMFSGTGVVIGAWWLFAFMLGVAAGALFRRLLPAMAVTIALFAVVLIVVIGYWRDNYAEPEVLSVSEPPADTLIVAQGWRDSAGREHLSMVDVPACNHLKHYQECMRNEGYKPIVHIHPADRYWRFQWTETAILLALTALLTTATVTRVSRHPA